MYLTSRCGRAPHFNVGDDATWSQNDPKLVVSLHSRKFGFFWPQPNLGKYEFILLPPQRGSPAFNLSTIHQKQKTLNGEETRELNKDKNKLTGRGLDNQPRTIASIGGGGPPREATQKPTYACDATRRVATLQLRSRRTSPPGGRKRRDFCNYDFILFLFHGNDRY